MLSCRLYSWELEIINPVDEKDIDSIRGILTDCEIPFEEDGESILIVDKNYIIETMIVLTPYYTLLVD